jgi:hypothetical protein
MFEKNCDFTNWMYRYSTVIIFLLVCFGHASRPCAARTRLFSCSFAPTLCRENPRKIKRHLSFVKAVPRAARTNGGGGVAARPAGEGAGAPPHHARLLQSPASRVPTKFRKICISLFRQILKFQSHNCVPKLYTIFCESNLWSKGAIR